MCGRHVAHYEAIGLRSVPASHGVAMADARIPRCCGRRIDGKKCWAGYRAGDGAGPELHEARILRKHKPRA